MIKIGIAALLIAGMTSACRSSTIELEAEEVPVSLNAALRLTELQIADFTLAANAGDNVAAERLAMYYDFFSGDHATAYFWFKQAALNGHVKSQFNLGVRSLGMKTPDSCKEAIYWFTLAASNGEGQAQIELARMRDCSQLQRRVDEQFR